MFKEKALVVNFFGAPGAGKTTATLGLAAEMKRCWMKIELVQEYAKELTWEQNSRRLALQHAIFSEQESRLNRVVNDVEVIITDAPLLFSVYYAPDNYPDSFKKFVFDWFSLYNNVNIYVERSHEYALEGRLQDEEQSNEINDTLLQFLLENGVPFYKIKANNANPGYLMAWLAQKGLIQIDPRVKSFNPHIHIPEDWIVPVLNHHDVPMGSAYAKKFRPEWIKTT